MRKGGENRDCSAWNRKGFGVTQVQSCVFQESLQERWRRIFTGVCTDKLRGNDFRLKERKFSLHGRKSFPVRVVWHWHSLSREAVGVPTLEVLKARQDGALSNLVGTNTGKVGTR